MEVGPGYPPFRTSDLNAHSAAFAPTGDHLLVASATADSTTVLARDPLSGSLQVADVEVGVGGFQVAVSGDGRHVYTTSIDALAVLELDSATGDLTLVDVEVDDVSGVDGLHAPGDVEVSPDDAHVYVSSRTDAAISVFSRNGSTGELDFVEAVYDGAGGITGLDGPGALAFSPDGSHLYVAGAPSSTSDDSLVVFSRDPGTGALSFVEVHFEGAAGVVGLDDPSDVQVSPDGAQVYVASVRSRGIAVFARTPATGALALLGHVSDEDPATSVGWPSALAFRPDGSLLYVASILPELGRVSAHARNASTGGLVLVDQEAEGQSGVTGLESPRDVLVSPDDRHVYVAASRLAVLEPGFSGCYAAPMPDCRTGEKSTLSIRESIVPQKRSVAWSLEKGDQTGPEDFDPDTTNHLALCVWDESGLTTLALRALVPADPDCSEVQGKAGCWKTVGGARFKYRDAFETPEGVKSVKLAAGESGKTAIKLNAKGEHVGPVALPLGLPVRVQLQAANGECWEAVYASATKSDASRFKAKSP
jgi:6-phosphogluconolactonase (cycloisomerase 2 family)